MSFLFDPIYFIEDSDIVRMGFSTKLGGVNPNWGFNLGLNTDEDKESVLKNREKYFSLLGKDLKHVFAKQTHSSNILYLEKPGNYEDVDGFITKERGLVLNILTADCYAILAHDFENKIIGAFHAGWRGTADKIAQKGIEKMLSLGASLNSLFVYLNPAIKVESYEVQEELLKFFPETSFKTENSKLYLDLEAENINQLKDIGVLHLRSNIHNTFSEKNLFSYRRDQNKAGRFTNFIYLV